MRAFASFLGFALFLGNPTWAADKHGGHVSLAQKQEHKGHRH